MNLFTGTLIFIIGATIGSFLSVVVYRLDQHQKKVVFSRSICPDCKKQIKWTHLIPIFSWLFLRGKCAYCGKKISFHYLALEILTAISFLAVFLKWNFITAAASTIDPTALNYFIDWEIFRMFFYYLIIFSFLIGIFFYDLINKEIPDKLSIPAIVIAFFGGLIFGIPSLSSMLIGGAVLFGFFALQLYFSKGKWIGGGDLRLGALIGVLLGWKLGLVALVISYLVGGLASLILLISNKVTRKSTIPFGPFLVIGTITTIFFGEKILNWYINLGL